MLSSNTDHHLSIQAKAKHEMLANLVLPAFVDELPRARLERRNTFTFQAPTMRTRKDGMFVLFFFFFCNMLHCRVQRGHDLNLPKINADLQSDVDAKFAYTHMFV